MKRFLISFLITTVLLSMFAPFSYAQNRFTVPTEIEDLKSYTTREVAIAQFVKALGIDKFDVDTAFLDKFSDRTKISYSYIDEMAAAVYSGLISGYEDKTLRPQGSITRIEALVILSRALSRTELPNTYDVKFADLPHWAEKDVTPLIRAGIVKGYGDGTIGSYDKLTNEQVKLLCDRIISYAGAAGDFYNFVNSNWLKETELYTALERSELIRMSEKVTLDLRDIIYSLYKRYYNEEEKFDENSNEKKIINVYSAATDQAFRDKIGLLPIADILNEIDSVATIKDFNKCMTELEKKGFVSFMPLVLDVNLYNSKQYVLAISKPYSITHDNIEYYIEYIKELFKASGSENPLKEASLAAEIAEQLSLSDSKDGYLYKMSQLKKELVNIDLNNYLKDCGYPAQKQIAVYDIEKLKVVDSLIKTENLDKLKAYLKAAVLDYMAAYMTTDTFEAYCKYEQKISGITRNLIPSDLSVDIVESMLGWELSRLYVDEYFLEKTKTAAIELTNDIIKAYEELLNSSERMTPATRKNAIKKLENMKINVGYPDNLMTYQNDGFKVASIQEGGSLPKYIMDYNEYHNRRCTEIMKSGAKVENNGWSTYAHTVNASYNPTQNCIIIPAGILQPPFFDEYAEYEENLGAIGMVIAHEISHAFDLTGASFDETGSIKNWWTDDDYRAFNGLCDKIVEEYSAVKTEAGNVDGTLTLNENLADIAAMSCVLKLADSQKLKFLFENYAKSFRTKRADFYAKHMLENDEHSPAKVRVNRVLSNFEEFMNYYNIKKGDGMYLPPQNRIDIWK